MSDRRYQLFDPAQVDNLTLFGDLGDNATNMFIFPSGTDDSPGSYASQAANLLNLFQESTPTRNASLTESYLGDLGNFINCGMENECFAEPVALNFLGCYIVKPFSEIPCEDEWNALIDTVTDGAVGNVADCLLERDEEDESSNAAAVLCVLGNVLPSGVQEELVSFAASAVQALKGISVVALSIADIVKNGLPGEVILFVFGWAELKDGKLVAPYKWWYCLFAVAMFVVGVELFKIFATLFIVWTKR